MTKTRNIVASLLAVFGLIGANVSSANAADDPSTLLYCDATLQSVFQWTDGRLMAWGGSKLGSNEGKAAIEICSFVTEPDICGSYLSLLEGALLSGREIRVRFPGAGLPKQNGALPVCSNLPAKVPLAFIQLK